MNYSCEQVAEALAAYALDALPAVERLAIVEHLAECREHDDELAGYRLVASRLPLLVEAGAAVAPASIRSSLLDAFDREVAAPAADGEVPAVPASIAAARPETVVEPERPRGSILSIFRQPALAYGMAAALLIAVLGLAAWNMSLQDGGENVLQAAGTAPGMSLNVEYYADQKVAVLNIDMPPPAAGKVYQAWMIADGKPVSLGLVDGSAGRMAFAADMTGASAVALSLEPAGGSVTPSEVKIAAQF